MATIGVAIATVTADAGYAYAKVYGAHERRRIDALIPTKAEPIKSAVPLRRYDARHDIVKCPHRKVFVLIDRFFGEPGADRRDTSLGRRATTRARVDRGGNTSGAAAPIS